MKTETIVAELPILTDQDESPSVCLHKTASWSVIFKDGKITDDCPKTGGIYYWVNAVNGKGYVGQSLKLRKRLGQYKGMWHKHQFALHSAMKKYSISSFTCYKICDCNEKSELNELELRFINEMNVMSPNGYNVAVGGNSRLASDETKLKVSASKLGKKRPQFSDEWKRNISLGHRGKKRKPLSDAHKAKLRAANIGKKYSDSVCVAMSLARKGKPLSAENRSNRSNARKGKPLSAETRAKISAAHMGKRQLPPSAEHRAKISVAMKAAHLRRIHATDNSENITITQPSIS